MRSDGFFPLPLADLAAWMLGDLARGECFGLPESMFFRPKASDPFRLTRGGRLLETPVGVAAGPHAQLPQNIVAAYLCGARFMELKTVQVLDELELSKPCIDMWDEGYNCEWSQELRLTQSADAYVQAFVLLHLLKDYLKFEGAEPGFVFNLSAGYSYDGVTSPAMTRFFSAMTHAAEGIAQAVETLAPLYPRIRRLAIEPVVSRDLTMSTMHGVPPGEIERIAAYFIEDLRLDFSLKLNPTLLGPKLARELLNERLGYPVTVPDEAFAHDLEYKPALELIRNLSARAEAAGVAFRLKLTNTLPTRNDMGRLPSGEETVYLSGRALHPLAVTLAAKLRSDVDPGLEMSFCAGLDAVNLPRTVACGLYPATICSDALKPGGYARIRQAVESLRAAMGEAGAASLEAFARAGAGVGDPQAAEATGQAAQAANLAAYAASVADEPRYHKSFARFAGVKTERPLPRFDCAAAPCVSACAVCQDVPGYLLAVARGEDDAAAAIVRADNAFPRLLGMACDQRCRTRCVRQNVDAPLAIREIKAFVASRMPAVAPSPASRPTVAVLGAGAVGLAAAARLARAGLRVRLFETDEPGGAFGDGLPMWQGAQRRPGSREATEAPGLSAGRKKTAQAALADIEDIFALGVRLEGGPVSVPDYLAAPHVDVDECLVAAPPEGQPTVVRLAGRGRRLADTLLARLGRGLPAPTPAPQGDASLARFAARPAEGRLADEAGVRREASRCLGCSVLCSACATVCPNRAMLALPTPAFDLPRFGLDAEGRVFARQQRLGQPVQLFNLADACNECGNCRAFCPSADSPYQDKPRLHAGAESFRQSPFGYHFTAPGRMAAKDARGQATLVEEGGRLVYEDDGMSLTLDASSFRLMGVSSAPHGPRPDVERASEVLAVYLTTCGQGPFPARPGGEG